jgi:hypothetical protein
MFNSVALNVVIGLVFIYLLYSLLATVVSELLATALSLRARNLKEGIDRMLNDEKKVKFIWRILDTFNILKSPSNPAVNAFYSSTEIKYLGSAGVFKAPTTFNADSFSKTVITILFGKSKVTRDEIDRKINNLIITGRNNKGEMVTQEIDKATAKYIRSLWEEAQYDVDKFKLQLENWFDKTMEHNLEWYKRKTRAVALILGILLAWFFNADTFVMVKNLSTDKDARDQLVSMANKYIENNQYSADTKRIADTSNVADPLDRFDTLLGISDHLQADIMKAHYILGSGCLLPDSVKVINRQNGERTYDPALESAFLSPAQKAQKDGYIYFSCSDKWSYFFWLIWHHFFGYLITAIAITLGAPFWYDILSKVMSLKTGKKETVNGTTKESTPQPITIKIENKPGEEVAG